jgi:hypothetical protein
MKEFIGLLIVAIVLIIAVVTGLQRSRKGEGEIGGKPADPSRPSEK